MSKEPKLDRKQLKEPDEFVKSGQTLIGYFVRQKSRFLGVLVFLVFCVVVAYSWDWYQASRLKKSWASFDEVQAKEESQRLDAFKAFYESQPNLRPRFLAATYIADYHFDRAKNETLGVTKKEAEKTEADPKVSESEKAQAEAAPVDASAEAELAAQWYQKALDYGQLVPFEKQLLLVNLSKSYEMRGELDAALTHLEKASNESGEGKPLALLNLGRIQQLKGDSEAAKQTFVRVSTEFVDTEFANLAKTYLRAMDSQYFKDSKNAG